MSATKIMKRERDIRLRWERDPNGPILHRDRAPYGLRTPTGFVWGHQLGHIFWMPRIPGTNVLTVWSRSMLMALGENYDAHEWDEPIVEPRVRRPWPILRLLPGDARGRRPSARTLHAPDRGCEHEHPWLRPCPAPSDAEAARDVERAEEYISGEPCEFDERGGSGCTGPLVPNVRSTVEGTRMMRPGGGERFYDFLWCAHFRRIIASVDHPELVLASAVAQLGNDRLVPDTFGLVCLKEWETEEDLEDNLECADDDFSIISASEVKDKDADGDASMADVNKASSSKKSKGPKPESLFSLEGLPKLEEFIPNEFIPDVLMVHDPDDVTLSKTPKKPIKYVRYHPGAKNKEGWTPNPAPGTEKVGHLHLSEAHRLGSGNHSYVYRAPLTLPAPLSARTRTGQVSVAAKLARGRCTAHNLLHNEGRVYHSLPMSAQEEWCGYNVVPQCRFPVPAVAIAPKFFGFYVPAGKDGKPRAQTHPSCTEAQPCDVEWASPILLMEECGEPVNPEKFTVDQRTECFSLILRLHHMDFYQGSFYLRNIMIQPGPLMKPPRERSLDTPSFRIIDFGRGMSWDWELEEKTNQSELDRRRHNFAFMVGDEVARARRELLVDDLGF